jgi:hypothetical protein
MVFEVQKAAQRQQAKFAELVTDLRSSCHGRVFEPLVVEAARRVLEIPEGRKQQQALVEEKEWLGTLENLGNAVSGSVFATLALKSLERGAAEGDAAGHSP